MPCCANLIAYQAAGTSRQAVLLFKITVEKTPQNGMRRCIVQSELVVTGLDKPILYKGRLL
jgi:hypothetical protein